MVVFIETGGFWRCERPSAFNIAKTPSFNETTIGFKFSTPRTRETANIRPSFTETVIQKKKNERFPLKIFGGFIETEFYGGIEAKGLQLHQKIPGFQ